MGALANLNQKEKSIQNIINYYLFHRKISGILKKGSNTYLNRSKDILDIYIINPEWIKLWKCNSNYDTVKKELDKINAENEDSLLEKLQSKCGDMIDKGIIRYTTDIQPLDNTEFANQIYDLPYILTEVFDYLIDYDTYKSFFNIYNPFNYFNNDRITGKITDKLIILILSKTYKIKFIYRGNIKNENNLIQLTSNFSFEKNFKSFCDEINKKNSDEIIEMFNRENIGYLREKNIYKNGEFYYLLRNEHLSFTYIYDRLKEKSTNKIDFSSVNNAKFVKLNNISSPAYLNSVVQILINIDQLTRYLLNENNFMYINNNSNICYFTFLYCKLLSALCCDKSIDSYDLKEFNEIIYLMDSKFKFNINCSPGDLIKFILEKINNEFNVLFFGQNKGKANILNNKRIIPNIISNYFTILKGTKVECKNCRKKINYNNSFILDFSLDLVFSNYKDSLPKNSKGKYIISLEKCFENYVEPLYYQSDDNDNNNCKKCKQKTNSISTNEFYYFPYILIISLNTIESNDEYIFHFPKDLNLKAYLVNNLPNINLNNLNYIYDLRGIISHIENTPNQKQYIAYCKHRILNEWYKYKDLNEIERCQVEGLLEKNADILIYESKLIQNNNKINTSNSNSQNNINYANDCIITNDNNITQNENNIQIKNNQDQVNNVNLLLNHMKNKINKNINNNEDYEIDQTKKVMNAFINIK